MKYKLGNTYFNIGNITKMTKPFYEVSTIENIKSEYLEVNEKQLKRITIYIDGKEYSCANYWDSDYNVGINAKTVEEYENFEKECKLLFQAFLI